MAVPGGFGSKNDDEEEETSTCELKITTICLEAVLYCLFEFSKVNGTDFSGIYMNTQYYVSHYS